MRKTMKYMMAPDGLYKWILLNESVITLLLIWRRMSHNMSDNAHILRIICYMFFFGFLSP